MSDFFVYCGLAGDTDPGRFWSTGLYRSRNAKGAWESIGERLGTEPHVFSILADSRRPGQVTVGTHDGIWRSDDAGDSWRRLDAPKPELGVWSLASHPAEPHTLFAGYEPCGIHRSTDGGKTWTTLPVQVRYPAVSDRPRSRSASSRSRSIQAIRARSTRASKSAGFCAASTAARAGRT